MKWILSFAAAAGILALNACSSTPAHSGHGKSDTCCTDCCTTTAKKR